MSESNLYNENIGAYLIGSILKQPQLLTLSQYPLCKADFEPCKLHQIIYLCATRLAREGIHEITEMEIENVIKNHPAQYEILQDNNYFEFIYTAKELCVIDNFEFYYNTIRKFSLLRELKAKGHSIAEFYDELGDEDEQRAKLETTSIQDILGAFELDALKLRSKYDIKYVRDEMKAGEDTAELIAKFEETPKFGAGLQSPYLTTLYQGWCRGHLLMRSAPSETGKSRFAVGDLCNVGAMSMWDDKAQDFIGNANYQGPSFFIHTEMDTKEDINVMFLSCVSGVEYRSIRNPNRLTDEERTRVSKAGEILLKSNITLTSMPDFTNASLERKVKELVENDGVTYGVFDYLEIQGALSAEYKNLTNMPVREDLVLKNSTAVLKYIAEAYDIGLLTMSQLNDNWRLMTFPDNSCLSGGKSMVNKLDGASIIIKTKERRKEFELVKPFIRSCQKGINKREEMTPNTIEYIFKARFNPKDNDKIKIWSNFNRGTFRRTDFFCTDVNNEIIPVDRTIVQ